MNPLLFSAVQTAAYGNGFECCTREAEGIDALFSSVSHRNEVGVMDEGDRLLFISLLNTEGVKARFPQFAVEDGLVIPHPLNNLTNHLALLEEIFHAAATLPPDPAAVVPDRTEVQRLIRARLGQHQYKVQQLDLWDGACAVTGITEPSLLRASHAKPWSDPTITDAERLDPANGLPLVVHLDALFDQGWISFADDGSMQISPAIDPSVVALYGLSSDLHLRHIPTPQQASYLGFHRQSVFRN